ncbi:hypothetical protein [Streptomyces sp. NBC_01451]|uniref:hypothetical protein n=1 Tax=Streptomyces sp. NBC_01451 TaxID=2903872 RepID=UPI002E2F6370|nr:hypothetical protein [Streptomyces sp. NBC_01451]
MSPGPAGEVPIRAPATPPLRPDRTAPVSYYDRPLRGGHGRLRAGDDDGLPLIRSTPPVPSTAAPRPPM